MQHQQRPTTAPVQYSIRVYMFGWRQLKIIITSGEKLSSGDKDNYNKWRQSSEVF